MRFPARSILLFSLIFYSPLVLAVERPPLGQLPRTAIPLRYELDFRLDPKADTFDADTHLYLALRETADHVWLHGKDLDMHEVFAIDAAGKQHAAKYVVADAQVGVARIDFDQALPPQDLDLHFRYTAKYSPLLEGIYKITRGDTSYVVSQMEAAEGVMDLGSACPDWYFPNASGRGYYRWKIPPEDTAHLHDAVLQLDPIEQLAYADAVGAGFRRGDVSATQVLEAAERLSASPSRLVSTSLFGSIEWIRNHLLDSASRPLLATWAGKTFHARLEKVGYAKKSGETEEDALLRSELGHFLAITVREPVVRQALLERGDAVLRSAGGGHWDLSPIDPDMPGDTLGVLVQERGAPAIDALMAALPQQTDAAVRLSMAAAIGSTRDPRLQEKVRSFGLSDAVKLEEGDALLASNHASPENLASYTPWFEAHFAQIRERSTESAQGMLPEQVADGLCSIPEAESLMRFLKPRLSQLNGGVQGARRADEAIRLCAALRTRQGGDAVKRWLVRGGIPTNGL